MRKPCASHVYSMRMGGRDENGPGGDAGAVSDAAGQRMPRDAKTA